MKQFFSMLGVVVMGGLMFYVIVEAATTATVTATVTAQNVSVTVSDGSIAYGYIALGATASTTSTGTGGVNDTQRATADGNVSETLNIKCEDSANWTCESVIGANQFTQHFCKVTTSDTACDTAPTWTIMQQAAYTTLSSTTVATTTGEQVFDLKVRVPSSSSVYTSQNVNYTVQAVMSW